MNICQVIKTYVDYTEDETVLRAHGEVAATSIAFDGGLESSLDEELVHLFNASNLVRSGVDGEHKHEDDGKENSGVCTIDPRSETRLERVKYTD